MSNDRFLWIVNICGIKKYLKEIGFLLIISLTIFFFVIWPVSGEPEENTGNHVLNYVEPMGTILPIERVNITTIEKKISPNLRELVSLQKTSKNLSNESVVQQLNHFRLFKPSSVITQEGNIIKSTPDLVFVDIEVKSKNSTHILDPFVYQLGSRREDWGRITAWVEVSNIEEMASLSGVNSIRPVVYALNNVGSFETEGNSTLHSKDVLNHLNAPNGSGIKIGIISNGINHIVDANGTGDLSSVNVLSDGQGDEGTAMAEIIHDIATNSSLYFCAANDSISFGDAIDRLVNVGCNIICDDITLPYEPSFEDGSINHQINAYSDNILFVSAAGNLANKHYQGLFVPQMNNSLRHNFLNGSYPSLFRDPNFPNLYVDITPGDNLFIYLQWDDPWNNSVNDYNLYLLDNNNNILSFSNLSQIGENNEHPFESIEYSSSSTTLARIIVEKSNSSVSDKTLELWFQTTGNATIHDNNIVVSDSLFEHSAASGVISIGTVDWSTTNSIEQFSSQGPVTIRFPSNLTRNKPDITGVDNVSVSGAGGFPTPFFGTSAAAPHIAGIAALLWSKDPSKSAAEIKTAILNNADPRGDQNIFGSGLVNASRAYYSLYPPGPMITFITPSTVINNGPVTITNLSGTNFAPNATVSLFRTGQPSINATNVSIISPSLITCTLNITNAQPGPWNITIQNPDGQTGTLTNGFTITSNSLSVTGITPSSGLSTGSVTISNLSGENFNTSATVNLTRIGQPNITATSVQVLSSSKITCTLPLTGKAAGQWNVVVTNPDGQSGTLANGFTITALSPGNTPFVIDPAAMNTFDGQYLSSKGYGWCDFGGVNNSYFKITKGGIQQYPVEFHLKKSFTTKAQFGILLQASYVSISGADLSTAPNADQRPVNTITNIYAPLTMAETGAAGIKVTPGFSNIKLVNVDVTGTNVPALHVDGSNVDIIGTNNPDPYLTTYAGNGLNSNWGTSLTGKLQSGYGLGLLQQTTSRSSAVTVTGDGGNGVNITGPFSGIELNGKTATLSINGNGIRINGTGTESGTGSDRNAGISAWGGSSVTMAATDSSITGQEYGIYGQGGAIINVTCPRCTIDPIFTSSAPQSYRMSAMSGRSIIKGGSHGLLLTGASTTGYGKVTIANVTVQGQNGYGIDLSQASGYNITITNPAAILGGQGKFGTSGSTANQINAGSVVITTGTTGPYPVNISLNTISGPDPYNLKIFNESGRLIYDITNWDLLPAGITHDPTAKIVSFNSSTLEIYSAVKYAHVPATLTVTGIEPVSGQTGKTIAITNLSGIFNPSATSTGFMLTRSGTNITATGVILESAEKITGNLSIPLETQTGPWQVVVEQNGQMSEGNVTFTIAKDITVPIVTTLQAENVTAGSALLSGNLTSTGGQPCTVFFGYGRDPLNLTANTSPVILAEPGLFNTSITGLIPGTPWYYTTYANNSVGTSLGVTRNFTTETVSIAPVLYGIKPSSGTQGAKVAVTNVSGIFNTTALSTNVVLSRSGVNTSAANVTVISPDKITGNFSLPPLTPAGTWQVAVEQDGLWSSENVTFTIESGSYIINATTSSGGNVSPSGQVLVPAGSNQTFMIDADNGYHLLDLLVDNESLGALSSYAFNVVISDHTIHADFSENGTTNYTVSAGSTAGGTISPSGPVLVPAGSNQTFMLVPGGGYHIEDLLVDNTSVGAMSSYTCTNVSSNHTIFAKFSENSLPNFTISAGSTAGGTINPSGPVLVPAGSNQTFMLTPDPGYHIVDILVDNTSMGAISSYTCTNVSSNHTVFAEFSENDSVNYTINAVSSVGGAIIPSGIISVPVGSNQTFTLATDSGYQIAGLLVDNTSVGVLSVYTFRNVTSAHRIEALFTPYLLSPIISGVSPASGLQNSMVDLLISGQNFYGNEQVDLVRNGSANLTRIANLSGNHLVISGLNLTNAPVGSWDLWVTNLTSRMSGMKKDAFTITAGQKKFYLITTQSDKLGWITPSGVIKVKSGSEKTFTMHTLNGADIENVTVDMIPVTLNHNKEYTFRNITADHTLYLHTKISDNVVIANFSVNQSTGKAPLMVRFTDSSTGSPNQWLWMFGDAKTSTLQNPVHVYTWPGIYSVRLFVQNHKSRDTILMNKIIRVTGGKGSLSGNEGDAGLISPPVSSGSKSGGFSMVVPDRKVLPGGNIFPVSPRQKTIPGF